MLKKKDVSKEKILVRNPNFFIFVLLFLSDLEFIQNALGPLIYVHRSSDDDNSYKKNVV